MKNKTYVIIGFVNAALIGGLVVGGIALQKGCTPKDNVAMKPQTTIDEEDKQQRIFKEGEHIISTTDIKPFLYDKTKTVQVPSHEGYEVLDVSIDGANGTILYVNTEEVICTATGMNDSNEYVYTEFGVTQNTNNKDEGMFDVGEHVIAKPISNPTIETQQYPQQEGYEIIGIDFYSYGSNQNYGGGWIIYRNTVPVKCIKTDDGYIMFGTPQEDNKVLTK